MHNTLNNTKRSITLLSSVAVRSTAIRYCQPGFSVYTHNKAIAHKTLFVQASKKHRLFYSVVLIQLHAAPNNNVPFDPLVEIRFPFLQSEHKSEVIKLAWGEECQNDNSKLGITCLL